LSDSALYAVSPSAAEFEIRSEVMLPVFLSLQSGLLALFPALSYAATTAKTLDPENSFMDALLSGVPVFLLTFNWPMWALIYQLSGSIWFLCGGLLFSGSRLIFTFYFNKIAFSTDTAKTISLLKNLSSGYLVGVCLGVALIAAGIWYQYYDVGQAVLRSGLISPFDVYNAVTNYYVQFYVSYIAATDVLVFGAVHLGSKHFSVDQLENNPAGLAASYIALTSKKAVFRGGRRACFCRYPV